MHFSETAYIVQAHNDPWTHLCAVHAKCCNVQPRGTCMGIFRLCTTLTCSGKWAHIRMLHWQQRFLFSKTIEQYSSIIKFSLMHPTGNINLDKTRLIRLIYVFKTQEPIYSLNMYVSGKTASIKKRFVTSGFQGNLSYKFTTRNFCCKRCHNYNQQEPTRQKTRHPRTGVQHT